MAIAWFGVQKEVLFIATFKHKATKAFDLRKCRLRHVLT
jgi:hypothetical protein